MPVMLDAKEVERRNKADCVKIKKLMAEFLSEEHIELPMQRPPDDLDAEFGADGYPNQGRRDRARRDRDRVGDMLNLPEGVEKKEIPMKDIMESADAQHNEVLKKPWYVTERSNRDRVLARFILDNVDTLIEEVPIRCKDFDLLPEQRVAIMAMTNPMPVETYTSVEISYDAMKEITRSGARKQPFNVKYNIEAGALPVFTIADYCTGSGKTIMAIMAALSLLCCRERWTQLKTEYKDIYRNRIRERDSGLCKGGSPDTAKLARLAIMFVPATMLSHWYKTALSAVFGVKEIFGQQLDVLVWKGLGCRGHEQTMQEAYQSGKPVLWVLPMEAESMRAVRQAPDIGYAVRIFDELNMTMRTRYDQLESTPCFNYVTQATIESLEKSTHAQPRHPLRMAFGDNYRAMHHARDDMRHGNYKLVQQALEHFCKMRQFAAPEFLRRLIAEGVQRNMPQGLIVQKLKLRAGTLAAVATGSDMVTTSLPSLVGSLLGSNVSVTVKETIKEIFEKAEAMGLADILNELDKYIAQMPVFTQHDVNAKQSVQRLKERMMDILGGNLPECPITMEPIKKADVRILKCCTAVLDVHSIPGCKGRCPLCRAPMGQMAQVADKKDGQEGEEDAEGEGEEAKGPSNEGKGSNKNGKRPIEAAFSKGGPGSPSLKSKRVGEFVDSDDDEPEVEAEDEQLPGVIPQDMQDAFESAISRISGENHYSVDGIIAILKAQVNMNPASRMLLCFGFDRFQRTSVVSQIISRIGREVPGSVITDIDSCAKDYIRMEYAKSRFDDPVRFATPHIFLLNTTDNSSSVQGLDLHMTDLTIVADQCSLPTQRQAAGRSLRMKKRPRAMGPEDRFPPKRVVVATISGWS